MPERITARREQFAGEEIIVPKSAGVFLCTGVAE